MKKINNTILRNFYESYSFILPNNFQEARGYLYAQLNSWSIIDSYLYTKNFKQIINLLNKIINNETRKNKILFILDDDIYYFFEKTFKKHHFLTNNAKIGLEFLQRSNYSKMVTAIIYIGKNNEISPKLLNQLNIPFFCFAPKTKSSFDYCNYNMLSFHGSILYLKLILKSILLPHTYNTNEKI